MSTRNYLEYRRSSVAGYRYNDISGLETQKDLLTEILFRGNYPDFKMHPRYNAVWEEYTSRYRLIKVCPAFKIKNQHDHFHLHPLTGEKHSNCDIFALECIEDESFAVFVGTISHLYSANMRHAFVLYVLDWQISPEEQALLILSF